MSQLDNKFQDKLPDNVIKLKIRLHLTPFWFKCEYLSRILTVHFSNSSIACVTISGSTLRIHLGSPNSRHLSPGHGWQNNGNLTTLYGESVHGRHTSASDEPNITTTRLPTAAAICAIPLSFPTKILQRAANAVTSCKVSSESPNTGLEVRDLMRSTIGFWLSCVTITDAIPRVLK